MNTTLTPSKDTADLPTMMACGGKSLFTKTELTALRDAQAQLDAVSVRLEAVGHDAVRGRVRAARDKLIARGELDQGNVEIIKSREMEQARAIRTGLKSHFKEISRTVVGPALVQPLAKVVALIETRRDEILVQEIDAARSVGVRHQRSQTVNGLDTLLGVVRKLHAAAASGSWNGRAPRAIFGDL
jgi:hypothetical protein